MIDGMKKLQEIYQIDAIHKTLNDFNRVQTRHEKNRRQQDLLSKKGKNK